MPDLSIRITVQPLSREQRRVIDRAARAAGLRPGPWCLSVALAAARAVAEPQGASAAPKPALAAPSEPLVKSFDPDA